MSVANVLVFATSQARTANRPQNFEQPHRSRSRCVAKIPCESASKIFFVDGNSSSAGARLGVPGSSKGRYAQKRADMPPRWGPRFLGYFEGIALVSHGVPLAGRSDRPRPARSRDPRDAMRCPRISVPLRAHSPPAASLGSRHRRHRSGAASVALTRSTAAPSRRSSTVVPRPTASRSRCSKSNRTDTRRCSPAASTNTAGRNRILCHRDPNRTRSATVRTVLAIVAPFVRSSSRVCATLGASLTSCGV